MSDMDEGVQPTTVTPTPTAPAATQTEKDWQADAEKWKALARKHEDQSKDNFSELQTLRSQQESQQSILKALAEKAGIQLDADNPDQLKAKLADVQQQLKTNSVETSVRAKAAEYKLDADALLDSKSATAKLNGLDPSDPQFADKVDQVVRELAGDNRYKTRKNPPVNQPSGDFNGTADDSGQQWTREKATAMAKSDPDALMKAIDAGLLRNIGFAPRKQKSETSLFRVQRSQKK
jgi:hypothetical protein